MVYKQAFQGCVVRKTSADCVVLNNGYSANNFIAFAGDPQIFAYCVQQGKFREFLMFSCPLNYEFDLASSTCVISCNNQEGLFIDPENCAGYYECVKSGTKYTAIKGECFANMHFDDSQKRCVRGAC